MAEVSTNELLRCILKSMDDEAGGGELEDLIDRFRQLFPYDAQDEGLWLGYEDLISRIENKVPLSRTEFILLFAALAQNYGYLTRINVILDIPLLDEKKFANKKRKFPAILEEPTVPPYQGEPEEKRIKIDFETQPCLSQESSAVHKSLFERFAYKPGSVPTKDIPSKRQDAPAKKFTQKKPEFPLSNVSLGASTSRGEFSSHGFGVPLA